MYEQERHQLRLVQRCLGGEQSALSELHQLHAPAVAAYLLRSGFSRPDAEDLTQEVFIRVFRGLGGFDPARGRLRGWIGAIAKNVARRHWRRRVIDREHFDPELAQEVLEGPDTDQPPLEIREEIDALKEAISSLPPELAKIVRMRYVEGRTTRGIASAAGLPESTVRLRLAEASAKLEEALRRRGFLADGESDDAR